MSEKRALKRCRFEGETLKLRQGFGLSEFYYINELTSEEKKKRTKRVSASRGTSEYWREKKRQFALVKRNRKEEE